MGQARWIEVSWRHQAGLSEKKKKLRQKSFEFCRKSKLGLGQIQPCPRWVKPQAGLNPQISQIRFWLVDGGPVY